METKEVELTPEQRETEYQHRIDKFFARLTDPFDPADIEWRVQMAGKTKSGNGMYAILVPYVTNRAIQQRLDDVCTPVGWRNEYIYPTEKSVICGISILCPGEVPSTKFWLTKWDGAEETNIEAVKGGLSGAMKRAAIQWGIGRYLYKLESAIVTPQLDKPQAMDGWIMTKIKLEGRDQRVYYKRPTLPAFARPKA